MNNGIEHLSHLVSPTTSGIVWLTDEYLTPSLVGLYELNYLVNGLLVKSISSNKSDIDVKSNFFLAENFGNPFFLAHSVIKEKKDRENMFNQIKLVTPLFDHQEMHIYIFNRSKNTANYNVLKELSTKHTDLTFENLNI
jgi:hypothetical protein